MNNNTIPSTTISSTAVRLPGFLERRLDRHYRDRVQALWGGKKLLYGKKPGVNSVQLMSNDYLSLTNHPTIIEAQCHALRHSGDNVLASTVFLPGDSPQSHFEQHLANFLGSENGILCQSGWSANTGLIQSIADENTPVYIDMFAHMSLWEGAHSAKAPAVMFHHNDPSHLERQVLRHGPGVIVVDSVYSTTGSLCPLHDVAELAARHGCVLVVDESHSLGTHGEHGEGLVAALGLTDRVHFRTASLAKAFAGRAGFIACDERFVDYFKFESRPAIFSSTLVPHEIAGLDATLEVIRREGWRREALQANATFLRQHLEELGYNLNGSESQIVSLESGTEPQTLVLKNALESRGIYGSVFFAPATAKNRSIVRFSVNSSLTTEDLERIVEVCRDIRDETGMWNWPSTRRLQRVSVANQRMLEAVPA